MSDDRSALGTYGFDPATLPKARPGDQAPQPQPTLGALVTAGFRSGQARNTNAERERLKEAYRPILEILNEGRRRSIWRPQDHPDRAFDNPGEWAPTGEGGDGTREREEARIWAQIARMPAARRKQLGLPESMDAFHDQVTARAAERVAQADAVATRNRSWLGAGARLLGGAGAAMTDPITVATLPVGGGGRTVATRILTEGLANAAVATATLPTTAKRSAEIGQPMTAGDAALEVGGAFALGAGVQGAIVEPLGAAARRVIGHERMTDAERAAAALIEREDHVAATSPFTPGAGTEAHLARLDAAMAALNTPPSLSARGPAPEPSARARLASGASLGSTPPPRPVPAARETFMARARGAESSGNDAARNPRSSATGRYQFTDGTWLRYHKRVVGGEMSDAQRLAQRGDGAVQERLMTALTADNAAALARIGAPETAGNLYLMHFAGQGGAGKILRAAPDTPIERLLTADAIAANPFLRGKTAEDVIEWAHARMNEAPHSGPQVRREQFADDDAGDLEWQAAQREVDAAEAEMRRVDDQEPSLSDRDPAINPATEARLIDTDPLPERAAAPKPLPARNRPSDLIEFLTDRGGLRDSEGHDLRRGRGMGEISVWRSGRLIRGKGMSIDDAGELLHEAGFFPERPTTAEVLDALERATNGGEKIYALQDSGTISARETKLRDARDEGLHERLLSDHPFLDPNDDAELIDDVLARMVDGEGSIAALEDEVMRRRSNLLDRAAHEAEDQSYVDDIPFDLDDPRRAGEVAAGEGGSAAEPGASRGSGAAGAAEFGDRVPQVGADRLATFDDPFTGKGATTTTDSLEHDIRMLAEAEPDRLVQIGDGDPQRLDDVLRELDDDEAAIAAARACMVPPGAAS